MEQAESGRFGVYCVALRRTDACGSRDTGDAQYCWSKAENGARFLGDGVASGVNVGDRGTPPPNASANGTAVGEISRVLGVPDCPRFRVDAMNIVMANCCGKPTFRENALV